MTKPKAEALKLYGPDVVIKDSDYEDVGLIAPSGHAKARAVEEHILAALRVLEEQTPGKAPLDYERFLSRCVNAVAVNQGTMKTWNQHLHRDLP